MQPVELVESILSESTGIATMPEVTVRIIDIVENPQSNAQDLHDVIRNDPVLSSRILKVVNSAIFALPSQIADVDRAIVLLGISAVKNIAIATSMTHLFTGSAPIDGLSPREVWRHSIGMAVGAKLIYSARKRQGGDEAFLAGLIADLGLLVERQALEAPLAQAVSRYREEGGDFCKIEREVIGADHQLFGKMLAKKWRFPETICNAIGHHHEPLELPVVVRELPLAIHASDLLACRLGIGFCMMPRDLPMRPEIAGPLGLTETMVNDICAGLPEQVATAEKIFEA